MYLLRKVVGASRVLHEVPHRRSPVVPLPNALGSGREHPNSPRNLPEPTPRPTARFNTGQQRPFDRRRPVTSGTAFRHDAAARQESLSHDRRKRPRRKSGERDPRKRHAVDRLGTGLPKRKPKSARGCRNHRTCGRERRRPQKGCTARPAGVRFLSMTGATR